MIANHGQRTAGKTCHDCDRLDAIKKLDTLPPLRVSNLSWPAKMPIYALLTDISIGVDIDRLQLQKDERDSWIHAREQEVLLLS